MGKDLIRVAFFLTKKTPGWLGGVNYLRNLLGAIKLLPEREIEPIIFHSPKVFENILAEFTCFETVETSIMDKWTVPWAMRKVCQLIGGDSVVTHLLLKHKIDVISHYAPVGIDRNIKVIGWIPDFQHIHLPQFFSDGELQLCDREYRRVCDMSDRVIVSSHCAKDDLVQFYPSMEIKADVLQFAVPPPKGSQILSRSELEKKFNFTGKYIYMPNQFWAHKNHAVLVNALHILKISGRPVQCLLTGAMDDYRNPSYFERVMREVRELDIMESFRVLGMVSYTEVISLMAHASGVINPSLFEGWSTTVEEAKAMKKALILSDIPVHREQASTSKIVFFHPNDAESLAEAIWHMIDENGMERNHSSLLQFEERENFLDYGKAYQRIVLELFN